MSTPVGPAQRWAQQQTPGQPLRWKSLEIAAFAGHPRVVRALGPTREEKREARQDPQVPWWFFLALPLVLGVAGRARSRTLPPPERVINAAPRAGARRAVARLSDADRRAVERDVAAAVDDLERRGLVTPEIAGRARVADLGMLSVGVNG